MAKKKTVLSSDSTDLINRYLSKTKSEAYLLSDDKFPIRDWISSGNYALNALLSSRWDRGYPTGRFTQLAGPNSVGKSYLCTQAMIEAQKQGYLIYLVDSEFGNDTSTWIERGINPDLFIHNPIFHIKEITGELLIFLDEINKDEKVVVVIDSVGNLSTMKETMDHKEFVDKRDMTRAQEIKAMFRQLVVPAGKKNVPFLIVNHEYDTLSLYSPKSRSGGSGPNYGSSIILSMTKSKETQSSSDKTVIGSGVTCTNTKNRFAKEQEKIRMVINFDQGLHACSGLFDLAVDLGYLIKTGMSFYLKGENESKKFARKKVEFDESFWLTQLKGDFGIDLNKKFSYQSHADILDDQEPDDEQSKD